MFIVKVKEQSVFGVVLDYMMIPIMALCQFSLTESLQRTHFWNNQKLGQDEKTRIDDSLGVKSHGNPTAKQRWSMKYFPFSHIPVLGGWKKFIVVEPENEKEAWFPGWKTGDVIGVSKIRVVSPVRLLLGPNEVTFFWY